MKASKSAKSVKPFKVGSHIQFYLIPISINMREVVDILGSALAKVYPKKGVSVEREIYYHLYEAISQPVYK